MISLLLDTSNQALSVAVNRDKEVVAEINTNYKRTHSETLLENINKVLEIADLKKTDIDRIIVAKGPGSYTDVRIDATVAKILAKGLNIPLYYFYYHFVLAASERFDSFVTALIDAKRAHVYNVSYDLINNKVETIAEPNNPMFKEEDNIQYFLHDNEKITNDIVNFINVTP